MVGDLNLSLLHHRENAKVKVYLSVTFQNFLIPPIISKATNIIKTNTALFDHILTNDFVNTDSSAGIVKHLRPFSNPFDTESAIFRL